MKEFIEFLNLKNEFERFNKVRFEYQPESLELYCKEFDPEEYITSAFIWKNTQEGPEFWDNLDCDWQDVLKSQND